MKKTYRMPRTTSLTLAPMAILASSSLNGDGTEAGFDTKEEGDLWDEAMSNKASQQKDIWGDL